MNSMDRLTKAGFTVAQANAILDTIVAAAEPINQGGAAALENNAQSVTGACDKILATMDADSNGRDFVISIKGSVQRYSSLTPKQFAALEKFWANLN